MSCSSACSAQRPPRGSTAPSRDRSEGGRRRGNLSRSVLALARSSCPEPARPVAIADSEGRVDRPAMSSTCLFIGPITGARRRPIVIHVATAARWPARPVVRHRLSPSASSRRSWTMSRSTDHTGHQGRLADRTSALQQAGHRKPAHLYSPNRQRGASIGPWRSPSRRHRQQQQGRGPGWW
jgi:hypothetical protein